MAQSEINRPDLLVRLLVKGIRLYQLQSPFWGQHCRFYPPCSEYMRESLMAAGFGKGLAMGIWRILKCHPWHPGGVDLVRTTYGK